MKTFKELYEACCAACEKRTDIEEVKEPTGDLKKACWKGYTAVGMKMKNGRKVPNCVPANEEVEEIEERNKENAMRRKIMDASRGARYKLDNKVPDREPQHKTAQAHNKAIGRALRSEESELDEARNTYALYDDHPKFQTAHSEIHAAVTNAHKDPKAVVTAMRKHKQVGATDSASRDTIYNRVKRLHGAKVANDTKVLDEEVDQIDELKKTTLMSYKEKNWKSTADAYNKGDDKKVSNRLKGMSLASRKLAAAAPLPTRKEDVEQIDELSKGTLRKYGDAAHEQESDIRYTLKRTEKSKHISAGAKDELRKLADRRKAGIKLAADKRGYYKGTDAKYNFTHGDAKVHATEEVEIDEAAPHGMSDKEYARHELGKAKKPEVKVGAKVSVTGGGSGVVQKIYDKELHNGQKRKFIHLKDRQGRDFHHRYYAHRVRVLEEVEQIDEGVKAQYRYTGGMHGEYHPTKKQSSPAAHIDAAKFHEREAKIYSKALGKKGGDDEHANRAIDFHTSAANHHRNSASDMKESVEQTDEQAPVAPTLDRKYLKGTPEHKAYKASKVRQKFRLVYKDGKVSVKEDVEQIDESGMMMAAAAALHNQPQYKERTPEEEKKHAERKAEKYLHMPGKNAAKKRKYWVKKVNKLHGIPEETDRNQRLRDALAKVKNDFTKPPADHKDAEPSKPASAPKPKTGGGMPYYPDSRGGRRYMGDSVEMNGEQIDEVRKKPGHKPYHVTFKDTGKKKKVWAANRDGIRDSLSPSELIRGYTAKRIPEEVEQIDELSKDTLRAYAKKAVPDMNDSNEKSQQHHAKSQQALDSGNEKLATKHHNLAKKFKDRTEKRMAGVFGAIRRAKANEEVEQLEEAKHRVNVTVSDPNHSAVSKRNETVQKFVRLSAADEKSAVEKAKAHYKGKGYKVHSAEHAGMVNEATYQGKEVTLNKPMAGDVKKSKVYVDPDGDGTAQKVNFGDKNMTIKKNIPARRKSFRARHNCENPGPKNKARYWSCKAW